MVFNGAVSILYYRQICETETSQTPLGLLYSSPSFTQKVLIKHGKVENDILLINVPSSLFATFFPHQL